MCVCHPRAIIELKWVSAVDNGNNRNFDPTFLFDFHAHYWPILHLLATIHNATDDNQIAFGI